MPGSQTTETTMDGTIIPGVISITAHTWTADTSGLFTTTADLKTEWTSAYTTMLAGHADQLTALQRLEGNAEAVLENTMESKSPAIIQNIFRQDAQREFDAIDAAMRINQTTYGIDPTAQFNTYTYSMMEKTLQNNEQLRELGIQGHGVNSPSAPKYDGFTTNAQNRTDWSTYYVGGGAENGQWAIANFFDDLILTHACFATVVNNGVVKQLNQNGGIEDTLSNVVAEANAVTFTRVYVASDFSTNKAAIGAVVLVPNAKPAPPMPVASPGTPPNTLTTVDGSVIAGTISGITAHAWTADATGLFGTYSDLTTEWKANYAAMLAGNAAALNPLQRMEGNAESAFQNTNLKNFAVYAQVALRTDTQREFDAIYAAMKMNQTIYGIDPNAQFTNYTYLKMEETLQNNEQLTELANQGHGFNSPSATKYDGYTTDFQNRVDGTTYFVGGGNDNAELAIAAFYDDVLLSHAPFVIVPQNGGQEQLNQNGNAEDSLATVVASANESAFTRVFVAADYNTDKTVIGPVVLVNNPAATPPMPAAAPAGIDLTLNATFYATQNAASAAAGLDPVTSYNSSGWRQGLDPNAFFDTNYYLAHNPDVAAANIDPLMHFELYGWKEGRDPSLLFSDAKYLAAYTDVKAAGADPLQHYLQYGQHEGRTAFLTGGAEAADPLVQASFYDQQLGATLTPAGTAGQQQAAWSYDTSGWQNGLNPDPFFDTKYYLANNPDVAAAHMNPLLHFEQFGWKEGRNASAAFSTNKYLAAYADVKAAGVDPLLHYVEYGQAEGRQAFNV